MNIFEILRFFCIIIGAILGYDVAVQFGVTFAILAGIAGSVLGFFVGPLLGLLCILPFEGAARLGRFITTGQWVDPELTSEDSSNSEDEGIT